MHDEHAQGAEQEVIQDVLLVLQGLPGRLLRQRARDERNVSLTALGASTLAERDCLQAVHRMCDIGWHYKCAPASARPRRCRRTCSHCARAGA
jgi:hypothetical protein